MLEAYRDFLRVYPFFQHETITKQRELGELYLKSRNLLYRHGTRTLVFTGIDEVHFPVRWRYDYFRALEYFASVNAKPTNTFDDAMNRLKYQFENEKMSANKMYPGNVHIVMNDGDLRKMNTLRAIQVFSWFAPTYFQQ